MADEVLRQESRTFSETAVALYVGVASAGPWQSEFPNAPSATAGCHDAAPEYPASPRPLACPPSAKHVLAHLSADGRIRRAPTSGDHGHPGAQIQTVRKYRPRGHRR